MSVTYYRLHFSFKHRLIASLSGLLGNFTYTQRHGLIRGMKRRGGLGFLPAVLTSSADRTAEAAFLASLDLSDAVVYDIGAFEGLLTLFFSRESRHVVAYEPNPPSYARLLENIGLNNLRNVTVRKVAVGDHGGSITLVYDGLMLGGASGDSQVSKQIQQTSRRASVTAEMVPLDEDIRQNCLPPPDLIKVDIEGMELSALHGMRETLSRYTPALYLEMHGATMEHKEENVRRIVEFLNDQGYTTILHVESGRLISIGNSALAREGHIYCIPASGRGKVDGQSNASCRGARLWPRLASGGALEVGLGRPPGQFRGEDS